MTADETKITVADLVVTVGRIEQWLCAVRKGLEALPQEQEVDIEMDELLSGQELRQPFRDIRC
ncbi:MAG: hypothetical protein DRJ61_06150 [Acidobacteria bacterium]|nr:MAG: hypothetical protein DRJ61_06150 [Acidobacteriota bacterium]